MRIAIVGSGISGLTAAYQLNKKHDITLYESEKRLGGHNATKTVRVDSGEYQIDTGFIVFNDWTYPNFIKLLAELKVSSESTEMGFSAFAIDGSFEYAGSNFNTLFSHRSTLFSWQHWRMLLDILRFNKQAVSDWQHKKLGPTMTLGEYLHENNYGQGFKDRYLIPMGAAIWSSSVRDMEDFPVQFFVQFFHNHGLLSVRSRPTWRVITGGSKNYIEPMVKAFRHKISLNDAVWAVIRKEDRVIIKSTSGEKHFDQVVLACHADQALALIDDPSMVEKKILGSIPFRKNKVTLHTDISLLPKNKRTWSSWNYCLNTGNDDLPILTYNMNILQGIKSKEHFCVTLNAKDKIDPNKILGCYTYAHPVFTQAAMHAQAQWRSINGVQRTWYCGSYWFNGFHEDGIKSALRVSQQLGVDGF